MSTPVVRRHIRITVVGDGTTGKTCMLIVYKDLKYQEYYIPTVFDSYSMTVPIGDHEYIVILSDTAGQEEYDRLRPLSYPDTDVFVICYAVDNKISFKNVERKWFPEVKHHKPYSKVILVATKIDLRDEIEGCVTMQEGEDLKSKIRADKFVECSSKRMYNVSRVFSEAMSSHIISTRKKKSNSISCVLT